MLHAVCLVPVSTLCVMLSLMFCCPARALAYNVNLRLKNKLTSEIGNFFTDTMRDSNSHEFEEMVDLNSRQKMG